ncbi:ABC transporter substrate-binding protein [Caldinitratiruptor microaerophilus]|uniref:ABC transporter substrate-binding protein n=1 Tax=Caldinitratiruptor microaerophilus TaxID=671077 RepID=A0AA35G7K8_9FIRM|nr:sugar ABC transporter substrate-binding protein [Caldinitratiruptor microaerophilus]BDG60201.1 ABC transporter substrate-binding protein [Caldinitratiruptor microaerophilus]
MSGKSREPKGLSRRQILKAAGIAAAGLATGGLGALLSACSKPSPAPAGGGGAASGAATGAAAGSAPAVTGLAKPKLRIWLFKSFVTKGNEILEKQIRTWAEKKNVDVEIEFSTFNDIFTKYAAAIEAGNPPDLGELDAVAPVRYKGMGQLLEVDDVLARVLEKNKGFTSDERVNLMVKFDGKYWAVPRYSMLSMFYYRQDLLAEKNLQPPKTWDEVVEVAKKVQDPAKGIYGFGQTLNRSFDGDDFMMAIMWSHGASWVKEDGKTLTFDTPETRQALQYAVDLFLKHQVEPPGAAGWTDANNNEAWLAGKIAMTNNGASIYYALVSQKHELAGKTRLSVTPAGPKGNFTADNSWNFGIFKKTQHPDLCKDLIEYIMSPEQWKEYMTNSIGQAAPLYKLHAEDPYWKTDPNFEAIMQNGMYARLPGYPGPITAAAAEVRAQHVLTDMASSVLQGTPIDQAIQAAKRKIESIYKAVG